MASPMKRAYVPIICVSNLEGTCSSTGCRMYHTKQPWFWQYKTGPNRWSNLPFNLAKEIEIAYRDVDLDEVELSPLHKKKEGDLDGSLKVCFSTMTVTKTDGTKSCDVRRLSTKSSVEGKADHATTFLWFLQYEGSDEWEVIDDHALVESKYLSSSTNQFISFHHNNCTYKLSSLKMVATKQDNGEKVRVRRRPEGKKRAAAKRTYNIDSVPPLTKLTEGGDQMLVTLTPHCKEAMLVKKRLRSTLPKALDINIVKVQNEKLIRPFQAKMKELKKNEKDVFVHSLFHCPLPNQLETICKDNFSPSLQVSNIIQTCGKGTYFFISAASADQYCPEDIQGVRVLMMADVFLGDVTKGDWSLTGPPKKPAKGVAYSPCVTNLVRQRKGDKNIHAVAASNDGQDDALGGDDEGFIVLQETKAKVFGHNSGEVFDTVVDDISQPETIVKYSKRDFYPKYIITFSK